MSALLLRLTRSLLSLRAVSMVAAAAVSLAGLPAVAHSGSAPVTGYRPTYTHLLFSDTFAGPTLKPEWAVYNTKYSTNPLARVPSLVTASNSALHVGTTYKSGSGLCLCSAGAKPLVRYGRWDIRARMSVNADHGFAILLWPNAENWPVGGEIDIAESHPTRAKVQFTLHWAQTNRQKVFFFDGDYTAWHTYSLEWTPSGIRYLIDGHLLATVTDPAMQPIGPMHLALQAGANAAKPTNTSASLDVDWINYYR